jgi:hypothetical protein
MRDREEIEGVTANPRRRLRGIKGGGSKEGDQRRGIKGEGSKRGSKGSLLIPGANWESWAINPMME